MRELVARLFLVGFVAISAFLAWKPGRLGQSQADLWETLGGRPSSETVKGFTARVRIITGTMAVLACYMLVVSRST